MGCYLSTVDDKVYLTEGRGRNFSYATASCQGWRREQEDAEACITDFDDNASLFVLCDGHGGAEVAKYTVAHFPKFFKNHELYKTGQYKKALEQAFIEFDAYLRTDEVMAELSKIAFDEEAKDEDKPKTDCKEEPQLEATAGPSSSSNNGGASGSSSGSHAASSSEPGPSTSNGASTIADDVDTETLRREAQVPIAELINKYADSTTSRSRVQSLRHVSLGASPVIRNKEAGDEGLQAPEASGSSSKPDPEPSSSKSSSEDGPSSTSGGFPLQSNLDVLKKAMEQYFQPGDDDSEDDSEFEGPDEEDTEDSDEDDDDDGDDDDEEEDEEEDSDENEDDGDDEGDEENEAKRSKILSKKHRKSATDRGQSSSDEEESEDDDEDDDQEDDEDETSEEEDDGGDLLKDGMLSISKFRHKLGGGTKVHTPGMDSGCTVVVALAKDGELYVASAGDSRCIVVMRDGKCVPMSWDHKPENYIELNRIKEAGGYVSEGRVNGGLNLSRAFGDFTYKSASLEASKQMITPCPDVKTIPISPEEVEYIFLACDGIWNSMKNGQVAWFIRKVAPTVTDLSDICVALFKECLAPTTDGDGTGCDNMTCILVKYDKPDEEDASKNNHTDLRSTTETEVSDKEDKKDDKIEELPGKRQAEGELEENQHSKRRCLRLLDSERANISKEPPLVPFGGGSSSDS